MITVYLQTSHKIIKTVTSVKLKSSDEKNKFYHYSWIHSFGFVNNFDMSYFNQVLCMTKKLIMSNKNWKLIDFYLSKFLIIREWLCLLKSGKGWGKLILASDLSVLRHERMWTTVNYWVFVMQTRGSYSTITMRGMGHGVLRIGATMDKINKINKTDIFLA